MGLSQFPESSMASSATNSNNNNNNSKPFHTYENVGYDDHQLTNNLIGFTTATGGVVVPPQVALASHIAASPAASASLVGDGFAQTTTTSNVAAVAVAPSTTAIAINRTAIESPFPDPLLSSAGGGGGTNDTNSVVAPSTAKILSTTDSSGTTTRMLTSSAASTRSNTSGQNLVTRLITFPPQSPMDSLKEWSLSTFKCTKQLISEKRGLCPVTSDSQLANDIEQLRENRDKLMQMLRLGQQMTSHYSQLVRTQKQMHSLMNEMSIKSCFINNHPISSGATYKQRAGKQVVANFSSLSNNLSSTTASPTRNPHLRHQQQQQQHHRHQHQNSSSIDHFEDYLPVLNHMKTFNDTNLIEDFKKNAINLNIAIKNGEKLIAGLNFYCSNLSTLINKTIEDTLATVKQYESARLEYDAEKNSLNLMSPSSQTSMTYSSDKVELARMRYEQLKEDVQIKMRFLEENTIKVMHKQLLLFNGAFASYTAGNTAALDSTLKQFSIRD